MVHIQTTIIYSRDGEIKTYCTLKSAALQANTTGSVDLTASRGMRKKVGKCYLQQASAPRDVWLSRLLSVSDVTVASLLGSVVSVDMDETSLAEEEAEEEVA